ncbi:MAG: hydroxylamine reductase [Lentisphaeria bacterium]
MFCFQCEQTAKETACTSFGVCGKDPDTAATQDALVEQCKGISQYAHRARQLGKKDQDIDKFVVKALFTTVTNVNFDAATVADMIERGKKVKTKARNLYEKACRDAGKEPEKLNGAAVWQAADDLSGIIQQDDNITVENRVDSLGLDVAGLQELCVYGLKGAASYADHAEILGKTDDSIYAGFHEVLRFIADNPTDTDELTKMALHVGELNMQVMELLDAANTGTYGHPEPTQARVTPVKGKCIVVSGHDLKDLAVLLEQTEGKGINVYTHGEMLPCLAYPELKKYDHLVGNYGGAWQDQAKEFDKFPGAILMTTNCIQKPRDSYKDRLFTSGLVQWPGVQHIDDQDFTPVIEAALNAPGFEEDAEPHEIPIGFAHNTVMNVADTVVDAVKSGDIRHFFFVGGCDGAKSGRNYYTELAEQVPEDCVILTAACGKYRFNKLEFGDIGGIPRILDSGQCNDSYSAIKIALALADAFECGVNELPLSLIVSWYEQKAVAILLTLLHLGIKDIRLGPTLPAFIGSNVLQALVDNFDLKPISTAEEDLQTILG